MRAVGGKLNLNLLLGVNVMMILGIYCFCIGSYMSTMTKTQPKYWVKLMIIILYMTPFAIGKKSSEKHCCYSSKIICGEGMAFFYIVYVLLSSAFSRHLWVFKLQIKKGLEYAPSSSIPRLLDLFFPISHLQGNLISVET